MPDKYKQRFTIESWVCDWGIYDNLKKKFIGKPLDTHKDALVVLHWLLMAIDYKEL